MNIETRHVRYIFADVERFTEDRTVDAQVEIVAALNAAFKLAIGKLETIYLPTGDGICAGIIESTAAADAHLQAALTVLDEFGKWSSKAAPNRHAKIRIAINESVDAVVTDVNGNRNLAGVGINTAQRLMSIADGNQIIAGRSTYDTLRVHDQYADAFRPVKAEVKHGRVLTAYQLVGEKRPFLDTEIPLAVQRTNPIDLEMSEELEKRGGWSTAGMVRATQFAADRWADEIDSLVERLKKRCNDKQRTALDAVQAAWEAYYGNETNFIDALRGTVQGTMYRPLTAEIRKDMVKRRATALEHYLEEWVGDEISEPPPAT